MKKIVIITLAMLASGTSVNAQSKKFNFPEYKFETVIENPITPVKNQYRSGTCWAYSGIGFVESEIIRINGIKDPAKYPDLSEFFIVSHSYADRAEKFIRLDGHLGFSSGSQTGDVLDVIRDYGIVSNEAMSGMQYGTELPVQAELDAVLKAYVEAVVKVPNKTLTTAWKKGFQGILDAYLGAYPQEFEVDGKTYTPQSYRDALKFKPEDYVSLTSYTHHPFYTWFAVEVCDNWRWDESYNVPIDEFMNVIDKALNDGYTVSWASDVSHAGFTRDGLGILVDTKASKEAGSDQEHWVGKEEGTPAPQAEVIEYEATQERRQTEFDDKTMTDDHGMLIYGIAKDQDGQKYYMVKNSWGITGKYQGIWYVTEQFVKAQSLDIVVHKDALTKELKAKLGIK